MLHLLLLATLPACIPSQASGYTYLPTPSPCAATITDPRTGKQEQLVVRGPWTSGAPVVVPIPGFEPSDFALPEVR